LDTSSYIKKPNLVRHTVHMLLIYRPVWVI